MTFSNFAGSLLLALTLASLSALAPPAPRAAQPAQEQAVALNASAPAAGLDTRLAMADLTPATAPRGARQVANRAGTVPAAGEFIPGVGQ